MTVGMLVPFFLTPFIVHHLGKVVYGVWILVVSLISYLNLLDFGLRGAIIRFVSKGATQGNHQEALATISTALWIRGGIGAGMLLIGCLFAAVFPHLFSLPSHLGRMAQAVVLITTLNAALTLVFGVFGAVLSALSRFDVTSSTTMTQTIFRAIGLFVLLSKGHGLLALALWDLVSASVGNVFLLAGAFYAYPPLRAPIYSYDRDAARKLFGYSAYVFLLTISAQIILYTDNVVVGAFVGTAAVALYSIGGSLVEYARQIVWAASTTFTPIASNFEATGRLDQLRRLLIHGTRATLCISLSVSIALFFRGGTFIRLWMGPEYVAVSTTVMRILIISQVMAIANTTAGAIAYGMERHKPVAIWAMCEALVNLGLSILLVKRMGPYGVAWGTTISALVGNLMIWPIYISRIIQIPVGAYIGQGWGRVIAASIPYALACYFTERHWQAHNLVLFFLQIAAVLPVFGLSIGLVFLKEIRSILGVRFPWLRSKNESIVGQT